MEIKEAKTDSELRIEFFAYHINAGTPLNYSNGELSVKLAYVLGPDPTWLSCNVYNGSWSFSNGTSFTHMSHDNLYVHGILQ